MGSTTAGLGSAGSLGGLGVPVGVVMVERRLVPQLWLIGRLQGGYSQQGVGTEEGFDVDSRSSTGLIDGGVGLRAVFTPQATFRFSSYLLVGGFYQRWHLAYGQPNQQDLISQNGAANAQLGLTLEHGLTDTLFLGISSDIGQGSFGVRHDDGVIDGVPQDGQRSENWQLGVVFAPTFQLRVFL